MLGALAGHLYLAVRSSQGIVVLRSATGDPNTWAQVNTPGMGRGGPANFDSVVDGATVYNGALYVAVSNTVAGLEVWRTRGLLQSNGLVDWTPVGGSGLGDPNNAHAELISFHGDLYAWTSNYATGQQVRRAHCPAAQHLVLLVGDGMGANHLAAANLYTGQAPAYQSWHRTWASTFPAGGAYDPARAWSEFDYVTKGVTDSAAAATALCTGQKTVNGRVAASADGVRLTSLADQARALGRGVGAVTSVYLSDATPGAWYAHNLSRSNGYAIADEGLWGDPNTTGSLATSPHYAGGLGTTQPPADVIIGAGHPAWSGANYVNAAMRERLLAEASTASGLAFVERVAGSPDGGPQLLAAAADLATRRLVGLFGGVDGHLEYRLADGSGATPENPTLAQMAQAALAVLSRHSGGFVLLVEGGAVDWAGHANRLDQAIGEVLDFNAAVQAVADWVEDPTTPADWSNTLVIVTADHETGYLTAGPGVFPDRPLGPVNAATLALEKEVRSTGRRASWDDVNANGEVDAGEPVYWAWNSGGHTNSLVPVFVRGAGAELLEARETRERKEREERGKTGEEAAGGDPVRGAYVDHTALFWLMDAVTTRAPELVLPEPPAAPQPSIALSGQDAVLTWPAVPGAAAYEVWRGNDFRLNPGDPGALRFVVPAPVDDAVRFVDAGVAADPRQNAFYAVRSVGPGGKSAVGPRVSLFQARAGHRVYLPTVGRR